MSTKSTSFDAHLLRCGFIAADTDTSFDHNLGRVPQAVFVVGPGTSAAVIYKGTVAWTRTTINLRSNTAGSGATVLII